MSARMARLSMVFLVAVAVVLTSCSGSDDDGTNPSLPAKPSAQHTSPGSGHGSATGPKLRSAKRAAKIPGCPSSDDKVAKRSHGLPDVSLKCLGGGDSVRLAGLRGKPVLITVWAQWCVPCRKEAPYLAKADRAAGDKMTVLGIDYDDPKPADAIEFARHFGWRFPQVTDRHKKVGSPLKVLGPPLTVMVDPDGKIVHRNSGPFSSYRQLRKSVRTHLKVRL